MNTPDPENLSPDDREFLLRAVGSENVSFVNGEMRLTRTGALIFEREIAAGRLPGDAAAARRALRGLEGAGSL